MQPPRVGRRKASSDQEQFNALAFMRSPAPVIPHFFLFVAVAFFVRFFFCLFRFQSSRAASMNAVISSSISSITLANASSCRVGFAPASSNR